jgi:2-dehydro-3-deoxyphosphogluconate aldolase/(4S)-4-hydroxy-2-oxoglutarate aldolase
MKSRNNFEGIPLIGILRGCSDAHLPHVIEGVLKGGMTHLEITMNSPGAEKQIRDAVRYGENGLKIGAGTVTNVDVLERALASGATFIVTPFLNREIILECGQRNIPVFPGAFSPTEVCEAWELGSTMVKVFPSESGGAAFVRALKGPFPQIQLLPTGGVDLETLRQLLKAGAAGAGIGSPLFRKDRLDAQDWRWLEDQARAFVHIYREYRGASA